jgi:metallo-beta-lactamase family protein
VQSDAEGRAHIQESDAEFINKRYGRRQQIKMPPGSQPMQPLYTQDDAMVVNGMFRPVKLHEPQLLAGSTKDAGFTMTSPTRGTCWGRPAC